MHTNQIYIARDGKSGMHVLVRILAVDDIGVDYPPIDPDNFNKLMMARDVKSLVLAARDLGPMYISADILSRRTFIPSHFQQDIECGFNLIPPDLESLLSECYFDPYAIPDEIAGMGYRAIGRTGKKATRELINDFDFTIAGDLSYLDSQFRAIVEPLHDWVFARNLLSILMRIGGLYRSGADPDTILEAARFRQVNPTVLKKRFNIATDTCYVIPIAFNPIYRMENLTVKDITFDALQFCPLYGSLIDKKNSFSRTAIENHLKGPSNEFVKFLAPLEASQVKNRSDNHENHSGENKWRYMVVSSNTGGGAINSQMQLANRLLQAFDGILFQPQLAYTGIKESAMQANGYNLGPQRSISQVQFIGERISTLALKRHVRKDAVRLCDCIVTLPRSFDDSREREFFKTAYTFLSQRYGVDNVVSAYVHKNSSRPHMHFAWVPVTKDGRLSAKNVVTRLELKTLHPDMQRFMESSLGCKVEILLDSEKAGERILSTLGLKDYVDAKAELERLDSEIAEKKTQLNEILRQEHEARERLAELVCSAETLPSVKAS